MRKKVFGRKFKRDKNQRAALLKGLMSSLVIHGKIKTTEAKAKAIKGEVDKLVTRARKDSMLARKLLEPHLTSLALDKFLLDVVPSFKNRNSGFTKTVRLGQRLKDNAPLVLMTWTDEVVVRVVSKEKPVKKITKASKVKTTAAKAQVKKPAKIRKATKK